MPHVFPCDAGRCLSCLLTEALANAKRGQKAAATTFPHAQKSKAATRKPVDKKRIRTVDNTYLQKTVGRGLEKTALTRSTNHNESQLPFYLPVFLLGIGHEPPLQQQDAGPFLPLQQA